MPVLLLLFVMVPIIEIAILIQVGSWIGALPTILIVILTAVAGTWLLRKQGLRTLLQAQQKMSEGRLPAEEMATGIALAVGGALLLTPGFVTDAFGFMCLIPQARRWLFQRVVKSGRFTAQTQTFTYGEQVSSSHTQRSSRPDVIDGEYTRED